MALTPADVHNVAFSRARVGKRGYSEQEVDLFIDLVEQELIRHIEEDAELESRGAAFRHAARVRVRTTDGRSLVREILHRRGSPENPVAWDDIERKFSANITGLLTPGAGRKLLECCATLEKLADINAINDILAAPFMS